MNIFFKGETKKELQVEPAQEEERRLRETSRNLTRRKLTSRTSQVVLGNDSWDVFDQIPKGYSLRTKVRLKLANSTAGTRWDIVQTILSLVTCGIYVASTYGAPEWMKDVEAVLLWFFLTDYLLRFYCCENRVLYPFTAEAVVDFMTILPSAMDYLKSADSGTEAPTFQFMRFARILRVVRIIRSLKVAGPGGISAVKKQAIVISLTVVSIVFISAGFIYTVEKVNRPTCATYSIACCTNANNSDPDTYCCDNGDSKYCTLTFGEALYFIVCTISTVGYGDISPLTNWGKACTAFMIILSLVIVPMELNKLTELLAMQSKFRTTYQPDMENPHVLVIGHVSCANSLLEFFTELYHPDRVVATAGGAGDTKNTPSIIMSPAEPSEEIRNLLGNPILQNRVRYIKGSIMNEEDMSRVGIDTAEACFLLTDKSAPSPMQADALTLLRTMVIENHNSNIHMYIEILNSNNLSYISQASADHVVCIEEMLLGILAKSCLCPGLSTLFSNMFRSSSMPDQDKESWMTEYLEGCGVEIYTTSLPPLFYGKSFIQAAEVVYDVFDGRSIILGVEDGLGGQSYGVANPLYVNPGKEYMVRKNSIVYVLCESKSMAERIREPSTYIEWHNSGNTFPDIHPDILNSADEDKDEPREVFRPDIDIILEKSDSLKEKGLTGHVILHADLLNLDIESFIKPLRPENCSPSSSLFRPILILSSSRKGLRAALAVLRRYEAVYIMFEADDDYEENFLNAGIYTASSLVLLPNKNLIVEMDGEGLDSATIFQYLTVQNIIKKNPEKMDKNFVVFIEMTSTSTMQVMNTTLLRRLKSTGKKSRQRSSVGRKMLKAAHASIAIKALKETEMKPEEPLSKLASRSGSSMNVLQKGFSDTIQEIQSQKNQLEERHKQMNRMKERQMQRERHIGIVSYTLLPFFAAGYGFSCDIFDSLLCQSFFTSEVIRFGRQLLCLPGVPEAESNLVRQYASSSIYQIPVPSNSVGQTFSELFRFLVRQRESIPIALYRNTEREGQLPYVYTLPKVDTELRKDDFVFVLSPPHAHIAKEGTIGKCAVTSTEDIQVEKALLQLQKIRNIKIRTEGLEVKR